MPFPAFPVASILDNFNRADEGPPPTGWTNIAGGHQIATNQLRGSAGGIRSTYFDTPPGGPDVEVYITIATFGPATSQTTLLARLDPSAGSPLGSSYTFRHIQAVGADTLQLGRADAGTNNVLTSVNLDLVAGDMMMLRCIGNVIEGWVRASGVWSLQVAANDTTYQGFGPNNKLGLHSFETASTTARFDDFGGGAIEDSIPLIEAPLSHPRNLY